MSQYCRPQNRKERKLQLLACAIVLMASISMSTNGQHKYVRLRVDMNSRVSCQGILTAQDLVGNYFSCTGLVQTSERFAFANNFFARHASVGVHTSTHPRNQQISTTFVEQIANCNRRKQHCIQSRISHIRVHRYI